MESHDPNLTCAICLECFHVPVTIPCGHTFCEHCISTHWDTLRESKIGPKCPICNAEFTTRPSLNRNTSLSVLTEAANSPASSCREPRVKVGVLLCVRHKKPLVYYCRQDKMSVCCQCGIEECTDHKKVLLEEERDSQELLLLKKSKEVEKLLEETQRSIHDLAENINHAQVTFEQTSSWMRVKFSTMIKTLSEKQEAAELFISEQREASIAEAEERLVQLKLRSQKLAESRALMADLHKLSDTELIRESTVVQVPRFTDIATDVSPNVQDRLNCITDVLSRVSKLVLEDLEKAVSAAVGPDKDGSPGSPQDKRPVLAVVPNPAAPSHRGRSEGLGAYRCSLTFDPRTANEHLVLSQENRRAEHLTSGPQPVPAHEARFDHTWQVLCLPGFTGGQHYWELEVSKPWAYLGVTYESIPRKEKGRRCMVGMNELSWSLQLDEHQLSAWHNGQREMLTGPSHHSRIGMLLNYEAGTLTYYGDGQTRLHTFHCIFTRELFPACWIGEGVSVMLCSI
ncbi:tripartite motif-containing protein 65 [Nematolebias whitei]|uniref:tripartite motif-containing protein 65 n=1 Tax=Nematolebias whitei TaxID=451745 RepID=UPI0018971C16|nr:tripartite motif-containing protein 65 [Nematolebias whitei]